MEERLSSGQRGFPPVRPGCGGCVCKWGVRREDFHTLSVSDGPEWSVYHMGAALLEGRLSVGWDEVVGVA